MNDTRSTLRYPGFRFPGEIISHGVWLYHRFTLSFRDIEDLLAETRSSSNGGVPRRAFDCRLNLEFHGSRIELEGATWTSKSKSLT
jgi:hypothetical protein